MKKTLVELEQVGQKEAAEIKRICLSLQEGECPECGAKLIVEKSRTWWDKIMGDHKTRAYCPINKSHYDNSTKYLDDSW